MAEHKADFLISLEDRVSGPAEKARNSLGQFTKGLAEAKHGIESHEAAETHSLKTHEVLHHALEEATAGVKEFATALKSGNIEGMIGGITESAAALVGPLDLLAPGLGSLAAGAVKAAGFLAELTMGLVDTALETTAVNKKLEATFAALGEGPDDGKKTLAFLDDLSTRLPQSRTQLADWTRTFGAMGVTDLGELRNQILATASAQAIMGDTGAQAYTTIAEKVRVAVETHSGLKMSEKQLKQLYAAGINVTEVAGRMGVSVETLKTQLKGGTVDAAKFGDVLEQTLIEKGKGPLEAMGDELPTLWTKAKEVFGHLFDDIDTSPITDALKSLIQLGDQGEPSGQALKKGVTSGMNAVVKAIGEGIRQGEIFFLKLELGWVQNKSTITEVISDFKTLAGAVGTVASAVGTVFSALGKAGTAVTHAVGAVGFAISDRMANVQAKRDDQERQLTGHATGGIVSSVRGGIAQVRPAPGEGLASIGRGERIMPAYPQRQVEPYRGGAFAMGASNDNARAGSAPGQTVHIDHLTVQAPSGITNAHDVTVTGLALALERLQLASGR